MSLCVVCQLPDRTPERGQVCNPDRARIGIVLRDIARLYPLIDLQPGRSAGGSRPSGKPGSRLPLAVDPLDLTMPGRELTLAIVDSDSYPRAQQLADQVGHVSVASVLNTWVRDWCEVRGENRPRISTVPVLVDWLLDRYQDACDEFGYIGDFAREINDLHAAMRPMAGERPLKKERLWVPCKSCNMLWMWRTPGEAYPIGCEIDGCGRKYTEDEYATWRDQVAAWAKGGNFPPQEPMDMVVIWQNTGEQVSVA